MNDIPLFSLITSDESAGSLVIVGICNRQIHCSFFPLILCDYIGETLNSKLPNPCTLFNHSIDLLFSIILIIFFKYQHFIHVLYLFYAPFLEQQCTTSREGRWLRVRQCLWVPVCTLYIHILHLTWSIGVCVYNFQKVVFL